MNTTSALAAGPVRSAVMLLGRRPTSVMIGRSGPLDTLLGLVADARRAERPEPAFALVSGDAGVGKTRLLTELARRVDADVTVVAGQAEPTSLGQPYGIVATMLGRVTVEPAAEPAATAAALTDRVLDHVGAGPAVVVFEDLHWADAGSVAVLTQLAARERPGLVIVASYRPDEISHRHPSGALLARLERSRHVARIHLEPLRRNEVGAFLADAYGRPLPLGVVDTMFVRTGGNPFFLEEIVRAAGSLEPDQLAHAPLPWSLADLVSQQLDGLSADERQIVEAVAVLGSRGSFDVLARMTGTTEDGLLACLRALVRQGLLVEERDDDFSFRHALVRDAVLHSLLSRERRRLHAAALDALRAEECRDIADLARHAAGAQRWDEMVELAREGVPYYLAQGCTHQALRLAIDALDERPDDADLLAGAARAAWLLGGVHDAAVHAEHWLQVALASGSPAHEAAARRTLVRLHHERDDGPRVDAELAALQAVLERLDDPSEERALVVAAIAQTHMLRHDDPPAIEWGGRAIEAAERAGSKHVAAQARVELGSALVSTDERFHEGVEVLHEGIEAAELVGDWVLVTRGLNNLLGAIAIDDRDRFDGTLDRIIAASERAGFEQLRQPACAWWQLSRAVALGDADEARRYVEQRTTSAWLRGLAIVDDGVPDLALLNAEAGDPTLAAELHGNGWTEAAAADHSKSFLAAQLAAHAGDPAPALAWLATTAAAPALAGLRRWPNELHRAAHLALRAGASPDDVGAAVAPLRSWTDDAVVTALAPVEAELAALTSDHERVVALLEPLAGVHPRRPGEALDRARMREVLALSLAALGRRADAVTIARLAADDLAGWPGYRRDAVDRLLARLTSTPVASSQLSAREVEVAAQVAQGRSNAELGRELFISPKTAAVHVSNILTKLGFTNRAEIAAWYVRHHGAPDAADR